MHGRGGGRRGFRQQHRNGKGAAIVLRLSELLERIRPAGTPGAAAAGAPNVGTAIDAELAATFEVLAVMEAEADEITTRAGERARRIEQDATREVDRIEAELPERIAVARADVVSRHERDGEHEATRLTEEATREAERRSRAATARLDGVVSVALERIWELADPPDAERPP